MITNVTLIKEDNRTSEQNFGVTLSFGDPGSLIRPTTLQSATDPFAPFDYSLGRLPGANSISLEFGPDTAEVSFSFFLYSDALPEGTEGFLINIASQGGIFPNFQLPLATPDVAIPAFASTLVRIQDNDCE